VKRDPSLDTLLALDGVVLVIDPEGGHWVKFDVRQVEATEERPHGLVYSLSLHGPNGERLVGFDNAHPAGASRGPAAKGRARQDHRHRLKTVRPYEYEDAGRLLEDFWAEVQAVLRERGVEI
jgi:hypothetical protein